MGKITRFEMEKNPLILKKEREKGKERKREDSSYFTIRSLAYYFQYVKINEKRHEKKRR